jgi:predicted phage gp36 major capsid-like protein
VLLSGRLKRLEHYYQAEALTDDQVQRYRELRHELKDAAPQIERLGVAEPTAPLED